jgi:mono/diheme cytochrome c family protein
MKTMIARALTLLVIFASYLMSQNPGFKHPESVRLIESVSGPTLYNAYCASCHGIRGKGDGPVASQLKMPPPDLTRIALSNGGKFPREAVEKIITGESPRTAAHGTREMPVWGPFFFQINWDRNLGRVRVRNLADYIEGMNSR